LVSSILFLFMFIVHSKLYTCTVQMELYFFPTFEQNYDTIEYLILTLQR